MENLTPEQVQQLFDESEKAMREALETINQLNQQNKELLDYSTQTFKDFETQLNLTRSLSTQLAEIEKIVEENFKGLNELIEDEDLLYFYRELIKTCIEGYSEPLTSRILELERERTKLNLDYVDLNAKRTQEIKLLKEELSKERESNNLMYEALKIASERFKLAGNKLEMKGLLEWATDIDIFLTDLPQSPETLK